MKTLYLFIYLFFPYVSYTLERFLLLQIKTKVVVVVVVSVAGMTGAVHGVENSRRVTAPSPYHAALSRSGPCVVGGGGAWERGWKEGEEEVEAE